MGTECSQKAEAAAEAVKAANAKISELEAREASIYERAMASMSREARAGFVKGEANAAARAKMAEAARRMDEREEKEGATYPVKEKPKVSAETPREAALQAQIDTLKEANAAPMRQAMGEFRASLGIPESAWAPALEGMSAEQASALYALEAPIHAAVAQLREPAPGATFWPASTGLPEPSTWGDQLGMGQSVVPQAAPASEPYAASADQGEFVL